MAGPGTGGARSEGIGVGKRDGSIGVIDAEYGVVMGAEGKDWVVIMFAYQLKYFITAVVGVILGYPEWITNILFATGGGRVCTE